MNLLNKNGLIELSATLEERHVLDLLLNKAIAGDSQPISADQIATAIGIPPAVCITALQGLHHRGILTFSMGNDADLNSSTFTVTGFGIALTASQLTLPMGNDIEPTPTTTAIKPSRKPKKRTDDSSTERDGVEQSVHGHTTYFAEVRAIPTSKGSSVFAVFVNSKPTDVEDGEVCRIVDGVEFADQSSAWAYADEIVASAASNLTSGKKS